MRRADQQLSMTAASWHVDRLSFTASALSLESWKQMSMHFSVLCLTTVLWHRLAACL